MRKRKKNLLKNCFNRDKAQATLEFVIALPACLICAVIILQALFFCSECASFDNRVSEALRLFASSPDALSEAGIATSNEQIVQFVNQGMHTEFEKVTLERELDQRGVIYHARLDMSPNIGGRALVNSILGFKFAHLVHIKTMLILPYNPRIFER